MIGELDLDILYKTRMWTLLGSWSGPFRDIEGEDARFFRNQMAKCVLAACDMILIKNRAYSTSYKRGLSKHQLFILQTMILENFLNGHYKKARGLAIAYRKMIW